jgi:hypothetical protein
MIDRKKVKDYFNGKSQLGPIILIIVGILTMALVIGVGLFIGGIVWYLVNKFGADLSGEAEVDAAKQYEIEQATLRAKAKLNVIDEQVQSVEPVIVSGRGFEPDYVSGMTQGTSKLVAAIKNALNIKTPKKKDEYEDPVYLARIGSDGCYRSSLVKVSVFMFGEKQLFVYFSCVDLTTGVVYSEGVHEFFYADINGMSFKQNKEKIFNYKKKRYMGILFESVELFSSGCSYTATLSTNLDRSMIDKEFAGMRSLIRERKES